MAPTCSNCAGTEFVWSNEVKTGTAGGLSLRPKGEVPIGTRICKSCGHADLFLHDLELLKKPHLWKPGEFYLISGKPAVNPPPPPASTATAPAAVAAPPEVPPPILPPPAPAPVAPAPDAMPPPPEPPRPSPADLGPTPAGPPLTDESVGAPPEAASDPASAPIRSRSPRKRASKSKSDDAAPS